jgi:hypothetical protein
MDSLQCGDHVVTRGVVVSLLRDQNLAIFQRMSPFGSVFDIVSFTESVRGAHVGTYHTHRSALAMARAWF